MELIIDGIEKSFGSKQVLKGASITLEQGRIYGLLGRNGSGKTTLFNCLAGELPRDGGGAKLSDTSGERVLTPDDVCYVLSEPVLPDFLTGWEFVKFYCYLHGVADKTPDEYLEEVGLSEDDRHRLIKGYSHGMKNKLQMLCVLLSGAPVVLLDEPLTSLDPIASLEMKKLLKSFAATHIVFFSTHIFELAAELCDELVLLTNGKLSLIDSSKRLEPDFEEQLIAMLKDDGGEDA